MVGLLALFGGIAGFGVGLSAGYTEGSGEEPSAALRIIAAAGLLIGTAGGIYGSWRFFRSVDEVEVADNLWGSLIGFYAYVFFFPTWWLLAWLGVAPETNEWIIFAVAMLSATAAYALRKWQARSSD
jgi:hypothetical protein